MSDKCHECRAGRNFWNCIDAQRDRRRGMTVKEIAIRSGFTLRQITIWTRGIRTDDETKKDGTP